jgi:hypothetical protein
MFETLRSAYYVCQVRPHAWNNSRIAGPNFMKFENAELKAKPLKFLFRLGNFNDNFTRRPTYMRSCEHLVKYLSVTKMFWAEVIEINETCTF